MPTIDPAHAPSRELYALMISAVVPRPVAWVLTKSPAGVTNLAPFSYFSLLNARPPILSISVGHRRVDGMLVVKDTLRNLEATRECVIHICPERLLGALNATSAELPPDVSEVEASGLATVPSDVVGPPRLRDAPIAIECRLDRTFPVGHEPVNHIAIVEGLRIHVADDVWDADAKVVDPERLRPIARLGGTLYATLGAIVSLPRPTSGGGG